LLLQARVQGFECGGGETCHNGRGNYSLCDDDRNGRIDQMQIAQRTAAPQHQRNDKTHDNGRQSHTGVNNA
jgi:hypothetical protein